MDIISSVGHSKSDLIRLLVMDGMWQYQSTNIVLWVPRDRANPMKKGLRAYIYHTKEIYDNDFIYV